MQLKQNKVFERPIGGAYLGTIIDVVEMPKQKSTFNGVTKEVDKVRVLWVLSQLNGAPYLDKEGKPFTIAGFYTASMASGKKPSNLFKLVTQVLQAAPPLVNSTEDLARLLLGRSNQLFLTQEPDTQNPGSFFTNVSGVAPVPAGVIPPQAPAGFVRQKDRPQQTAGPQPGQTTPTYQQPPQHPGQTTPTYQQPPQHPAGNTASVNLNVPAPPTNEAF